MNPTEAAICERLRKYRELIGWPQTVFARETGTTRDQLVSIELGRTPLRYGLARRFAERYNINWRWLVTGKGSPQTYWTVPAEVEQRIPRELLLSKAYSQFLEPGITPELMDLLTLDERTGATQVVIPPTGIPPANPHQWIISDAVREAFNLLPETAHAALCDHVLDAANHFCTAHGVRSLSYTKTLGGQSRKGRHQDGSRSRTADRDERNALTHCSTSNITGGVTDQWLILKRQLQEATAPKGMKGALAKFLDVDKTRISQWLAPSDDSREPGADYALKMLNWLNDPQRRTQ